MKLMWKPSFSIVRLLGSFRHAFRGMLTFLRREQNARIHAVAALVAVGLSAYWRIQPWEWVAVVCSIAMVLAAELLNSAIEALCDHVTPEQHADIKVVKDLAAAAVVVVALAALVVGILVFGPRIKDLLPDIP